MVSCRGPKYRLLHVILAGSSPWRKRVEGRMSKEEARRAVLSAYDSWAKKHGRLSLLPILTGRKVGPSRFPYGWQQQVGNRSRLDSRSAARLGRHGPQSVVLTPTSNTFSICASLGGLRLDVSPSVAFLNIVNCPCIHTIKSCRLRLVSYWCSAPAI